MCTSALRFGMLAGLCGLAASASAAVTTVPTLNPSELIQGLGAHGLTVTRLSVVSGVPGQIGTYRGFNLDPVTIRNGIVMSSGSVADLSPLTETSDPAYEPASPPARVNSMMVDTGNGGTPEFDDFGSHGSGIENFNASYDVAAIEVEFTLAEDSQVQFDFLFGSVEFPVYTSQFTDAFLVFLDGTQRNDQIAFDSNNQPVQVGRSFAGLETTADGNSAFASPHALIHHLTTTTARLDAGVHTLRFEIGDVNDHVLDSAVFIANLRTGTGTIGTDPSDDCIADFDSSGTRTIDDLFAYLHDWFDHESDCDVDGDGVISIDDVFIFINLWFRGC